MGWEPMSPLREVRHEDRLLYALDEDSLPLARRAAAETYDFTLAKDRWSRLIQGLGEVALMALWPWSLALLFAGSGFGVQSPSATAGYFLLTATVIGLQFLAPSIEGPPARPAVPLPVWLGLAGFAVLLGRDILPSRLIPLLPVGVASAVVFFVAWRVRDFRPGEIPVAVHAPPGAEPIVIAAVLRDQRRASPARIAAGLGLEPGPVREWLMVMQHERLVASHAQLLYGPRPFSLTHRGARWLEAFQARTG